MASLRLVSYGPAAAQALREAIAVAKAGDALAPVTVAVPSNYAGLSLRREMALDGGLVNVRFVVFARVAELLGAPALAAQDRRPLTTPTRGEAVRAALAAGAGVFHDVADHSATERSLDYTFRELRQASAASLDAIARRSARAADVVRLFRDVRARTERYYDEEDLGFAAAQAVRDGTPALRDVGHVVLYLVRHLTPGETSLAEALAQAHGLSAVLGLTGDAEADIPSRRIGELLTPLLAAPDETPAGDPPAGTRVIAVTDAEEEVRTALRLAMERLAGGTPLHRMAVLYPAAQPYALLAHEQFRAAGVPHNGPSVRTLAQTLSGRTLLGLLRLREIDLRRDALMDWLSAAPVLEAEHERPAPAHRWDTLSRAAGIVAGAAQWRDRLARYARSLETRREALERTEDGGDEWQRASIERDLEQARRLGAFVEELAKQIDPGRRRTWAEYASWGRALLARYLGGEGHRASWPDDEIEAHRKVEEALDALSALGDLREETDEATFRRALERELEAPAARVGRFGEGVFIGRIADAMGTGFDVAFLIGMSEGLMPPRPRDDPLLPDRERAGADVPLRTERRAEERRDYLAALACAPERTLIYPRADLRGQRGRLPARWLLETASLLGGRTLFSKDMEELRAPWSEVVPSFEGALADGREAASQQEYDLRSLLRWTHARHPVANHYLVRDELSLSYGLIADASRHHKELTRWDGCVDGFDRLAPSEERAVSPTALQHYAACPFRYFLGHVLYVAALEKPEETIRITPLERGNLIHHALEQFVRDAPARTTPEQPWTEEERARLLAIGARLCDDAERAGITGRPLLWRLDRARIMRDLAGFLDQDEALRRTHGVVPAEVELGFGLRGTDQAKLTVTIGTHRIAFRGRIDRVDRAPDDSHLLVLDYKTGTQYGMRELPGDPVRRGQSLQLPIYGLAAQERLGRVAVDGYYWFVSEQEGYARVGYAVRAHEIQVFQDALGTIVDGITRGLFPARPGQAREDSYENCSLCPYDAVCARDRARAWARKRGADVLERYLDLAEPS